MRKETPDLFSAPFFKQLNIAPFALDADLLDLSPTFRTKLRKSLLNGWSPDHSLIIATSEDPRLNHQPLQGRQRLIEIAGILKDKKPFDLSKILIRYEHVRNADELRLKRAALESSAALSKDPRISKRWIDHNVRAVVKSRASSGQTSILKYLHANGFNDDTVSREIIDSVMESMEKKRKKKQPKTTLGSVGGQSTLPDRITDKSSWGLENKPASHAASPYDNATSYLREVKTECDHCGKEVTVPINIAVGDERQLVKVELAKLAIER